MPINTTGLFAGFDLQDAKSLQNLKAVLSDWYPRRHDEDTPLPMVTTRQFASIQAITQRMDSSPLIEHIIQLFLKVADDDASILAGGARLNDYAVPEAEIPGLPQYKEAFNAWNNQRPLQIPEGIIPNHEAVNTSIMDAATQAAGQRYYASGQYGEEHREKRQKALSAPLTNTKEVAEAEGEAGGEINGSRTPDNVSIDKTPSSSPSPSIPVWKGNPAEEEAKNLLRPVFGSRPELKANKAPRRDRDEIPLPEGVNVLGNAHVGEVDWSLLYLHYKTVRFAGTPKETKGRIILNSYQWRIDWNNADDIKRLNAWRRQLTGRCFPQIRKSRPAWIEDEKDEVLRICEKQMTKAKGPYVKWKRLANEFNRNMGGKIQKKGSKMLSVGTRKSDVTESDRAAPWRTSQSIAGIAKKWKEFNNLVEKHSPHVGDEEWEAIMSGQYDEKDLEPQSCDDEEIPDPNPDPSGLVSTRKRHPVAKKTDDNAAMKISEKISKKASKGDAKSASKDKVVACKKRKADEISSDVVEEEGADENEEVISISSDDSAGSQYVDDANGDDTEEDMMEA